MYKRGFTLIEVMVALVIVGGSVITLFYRGTKSLETVVEAVLKQEAMHIADTVINEIYAKGYTFYEEQGYLPEDETGFEIRADFSAEEILLSSLTEGEGEPDVESEEEKEKEEKIVLVHIKVTVASKEDKDISVSLTLDLPADTAGIKGIEAILPDTTEK